MKNPKRNCDGMTPFHFAALNGHLEICNMFIENLEDKNPRANDGWTPLHYAAKYGHIQVCTLIAKFLREKNPRTNDGATPHELMVNFSLRVFQPKP